MQGIIANHYLVLFSMQVIRDDSHGVRFTRLILTHSKKLLPFQRDLRGETPLEICAMHGDHESVAAMLKYTKVCISDSVPRRHVCNSYQESSHFDVQNIDFRTSMAKVVMFCKCQSHSH
jgi:hypothetical protein